LKPALYIGLIGGFVIGLFQFYAVIHSMGNDASGGFDFFLYNSPRILYFMCIYMSIKLYARSQPGIIPDFKGCLKAGGICMAIILLLWFIAFFVAFTHTDVPALIKYNIEHGHKAEVPNILNNFTKQGMFDRALLFSYPNFILGFAAVVLVTIIFRLRGKKTA
jgi:hypothetical protein